MSRYGGRSRYDLFQCPSDVIAQRAIATVRMVMATEGPVRIAEIRERGAERLWAIDVRGYAAHRPFIDAAGGSVYLSDGWGRGTHASLRLRRYDLATGAEVARWPCGTIVRCAAFVNEGRELIVATDKRLARLDAATLVEHGRWERSARYSDSIAVVGNVAVLANWHRPTITLIDLDSGQVRRRRHREMTLVLDRADSPLLIDGGRGGVSALDPITGVIRQLLDTPPAFQAAVTSDRTALWLTIGVRTIVTPRPHGLALGPGAATSVLERYDLDGRSGPLAVELPLPVRTIAASSRELWLTPGPVSTEAQHVVTLADPPGTDAQVWRPEHGELIVAVDPAARLILTSRGHPETLTSTVSCFRLAG